MGEITDITAPDAPDGSERPDDDHLSRRRRPVAVVVPVVVTLSITVAGLMAVGFVDAARACTHWKGSGSEYDRCWSRTRPGAPYVLLGLIAFTGVILAVVVHGGRSGASRLRLWFAIGAVATTVAFDAWLAVGLDWVPLREGGYPVVLLPTLVLVNGLSAWWLVAVTVEDAAARTFSRRATAALLPVLLVVATLVVDV